MLNTEQIEGLIAIVEKANQKIMALYNEIGIPTATKADESPVTLADQTSHECIHHGLSQLTPDIPIISEESPDLEQLIASNPKLYWLVDPLDGTKEFIHKNGEFAVCVALIQNQEAIAGFIGVPAKNIIYGAVRNQGCFRFNGEKITRLKLQKKQSPDIPRIAVSKSHRSSLEDVFLDNFEATIAVPMGSILKMLAIIEDEVDYYPRFDQKTKLWDIAAGQIILEEAGGTVLHYETKEALRYDLQKINNGPFLAQSNFL